MSEYTSEDDGYASSQFELYKKEAREKYKAAALRVLAEAMKQAQAKKADIEAQLSKCNAELDVLRFERIPEQMEQDGVPRITYEGIGRLSLTEDLRVAVKPGMKEDLFNWLKKFKLGSLIQPGVNASTLKAFVKGRIKEGKPYPDEMLNVTAVTRAAITKA